MKVCLYIRLSDADSDLKFKSESESISNQRALLTQYLKSHREFYPYEIVEFVDDGFSGTNGNRPAFERMTAFLQDGGAKLVLCKDLSRFFRNYVEIFEQRSCGDSGRPSSQAVSGFRPVCRNNRAVQQLDYCKSR